MQHKKYKIHTLFVLFVLLIATNNLGYASTINSIVEKQISNNVEGNVAYEQSVETTKDTIINEVKSDTVSSGIYNQLNDDSLKVSNRSLQYDSTAVRSGIILPDSMRNALEARDTLKRTFKSDTMFIKSGVFPTAIEKFLDEQALLAKQFDTITDPKKLKKERDKIIRDSLKIKTFTETVGMSFVLPGYGQIRNKQYWKLPVLYATTGSMAYLTINASSKFKKYDNAYNYAYSINVPQDNLDELLRERNKYNTQKTVFMIGTALTYIYFVGDAALNYKGDIHPTKKATMLSAVFPGAGQVYNKSYWKLPIIYGGLATFGYVIDYNNRGYKRFKTAYEMLTDGNDATVDEFNGYYSSTFLENTRDSYRRYRDLGIILTCGFYLLNIIDAHVEAYLKRYDVSDDLAMTVEPTLMPAAKAVNRPSFDGIGMSMKINF
ncbi:MAG: DUF5683 domain-containing protein [Rikenellaceae bacterium]